MAAGPRPLTAAQGGWMQREQALLGTIATVQLWADDRARGAAVLVAVMGELRRIDQAYRGQRADSELAMVNTLGTRQPVRVSDECFRLVARAQELVRLTGGAFSIGCSLALDAAASSLQITAPGGRLTLEGLIGGYATERATRGLARQGVPHAIVSVGGCCRLLGDRRGQPWTVTLRDPQGRAEAAAGPPLALLPLQDVAVATVDAPNTTGGRDDGGADGLRSATVIAADGLTAAALAHAAVALGMAAGMALVEGHAGADAVLLDAQGRLHCSSGFDTLGPQQDRARARA
ncbi:FAD:protein FMN transferase [Pseudorhodoferax sp.]|uniref:FAD:protein FMN transferase n=1 Tax=Pseudorhodoferax sp. TaxID=1993553 RepID=UPI002DD66A5E|nr:FAD:protein FMN transferase [Pseudorhodoferax sp.]